MIRYYTDLLRLLAAKGFRLTTGETPREFALRLQGNERLTRLLQITELYYSSRYEGYSLSPDELAMIEEFRRELKVLPRITELMHSGA